MQGWFGPPTLPESAPPYQPDPRRTPVSEPLVLHDPHTYDRGFPHEYFRELRASAPVSHHGHPGWERGYWAIARHDDVRRVSRDGATFRNAPHPFLDATADNPQSGSEGLLISLDAPEHIKM